MMFDIGKEQIAWIISFFKRNKRSIRIQISKIETYLKNPEQVHKAQDEEMIPITNLNLCMLILLNRLSIVRSLGDWQLNNATIWEDLYDNLTFLSRK